MATSPKIAILIMAAGLSTRMGRDKLLLRYNDGTPLLADRIAAALCTKLDVFVAVGAHQEDRMAIINPTQATALICDGSELGLGHSLAQSIQRLPVDLDGVIILLADMPAITTDDLQALRDEFGASHITRGATHDDTPGHPVLIPAKYLSELQSLHGDQGAQSVLKNLPTQLVQLPDNHASLDVDTPDQWQLWKGDILKDEG